MTNEQKDYELAHNEPVWVRRQWVLDIGKVVMRFIAPFINEETAWKVGEYFGKRGHYLKVGKLTYNWKDFENVQQIYREQFK